MPRRYTSLTLGYHGCDRQVGEDACSGAAKLQPSRQDYDWLGPGVYFWEDDPVRAAEWAHARVSQGKATEAFVVGAIIDLGNCLDLTRREAFPLMRNAYQIVCEVHRQAGTPMPENKAPRGKAGGDKLLRYLDCEVIRFLHASLAETARQDPGAGIVPFDTVRCPFFEGDSLYPGAGFFDQTHVQVAVTNPERIIGVFRPRDVEAVLAEARPAPV